MKLGNPACCQLNLERPDILTIRGSANPQAKFNNIPNYQDSEAYLDSVARADAEEEKQCWVCFATEEDDPTAVWVHPCKYVIPKECFLGCVNSSSWLPWLS